MPVSFDALSRHFVEVNLGEQQHGATREQIMARLDEMSAKLERILLEYRERYGTTGGFVDVRQLTADEALRRTEEILQRLNKESKDSGSNG